MPYNDLRIGRYSEKWRTCFVTAVLVERKRRYFSDFVCARLVVSEMRTLHDDQVLNSLAWVIVPDHGHWLFQLREAVGLSSALKCFKAHSAHRVNA